MEWKSALAGGFICGAMAGGGARYGRVCSMSAIEDALMGQDYRGAKAWGLAVTVAMLTTMALVGAGLADLTSSPLRGARLHVLGTVLGGLLFGLGMTLVGTCSFGLVVRAGGGDLRALVSSAVVGVFAFALTAGMLSPVLKVVLGFGWVDLGGASFDAVLTRVVGRSWAVALIALFLFGFAAWVLTDRRLWARQRLVAGAIVLGLAVAGGWLVTSHAVAALELSRVESLSFVAPGGRALLQFMTMPFRDVGFGIAAVIGACAASFGVAAARGELRWEAFDDAREMRRHLSGAALMGVGGVLAQGCTVGQGLSAASALAVSAPVFVVAVLVGAHIGLKALIEGTALWRLGFSPRAD